MSIAKSYSAQLVGLECELVTIEVDISNGLHAFSVVGLGDRSVEEAKDRVSAAIKNSGYVSPKQKNQKVVISLAPADVRKEGTSFDLAMAIGYLAAAGDIELDPDRAIFLGELSLEGNIRRISGLLPILCQAPELGITTAFIPEANLKEASLARNVRIFPVSTLQDVVDHISFKKILESLPPQDLSDIPPRPPATDMSVIRGNETAKRGLEIAAAGAHNILMFGPPGTGKTMLAQSFPSILPPLSYEESLEVTGIHSAARTLREDFIRYPPFRAPHHTASYPSVVGGGSFPRPGEITLAHRGVLFLDELPEFDRTVLEALRQPLEENAITISRAKGIVRFPAQCILVASMNPCPCGKGRDRGCMCTMALLESYRRKMSGPIMDRIDLWVSVSKIDYAKLSSKTEKSETSTEIRDRIVRARDIQRRRFAHHGIKKTFNGEMSAEDIEKCIVMAPEARAMLARSAEKFELSGRGFHRVVKVARTIADLRGLTEIGTDEIMEAIQYRQKVE